MRAAWVIILLMGGLQLQAQEAFRLARPLVTIAPTTFTDSALVSIDFGKRDAEIYYQLNSGKEIRYAGPFWLHATSAVDIQVRHPGFVSSEVLRRNAVRVAKVPISWLAQTTPAEKYPDSGAELTDLSGALPGFLDSGWCGYDHDSVRFHFRSETALSGVGFATLKDEGAWILPPGSWKLTIRQGGKMLYHAEMQGTLTNQVGPYKCFELSGEMKFTHDAAQAVEYELILFPAQLPPEHPGAGANAWIFIDELILHP